MPKRKMSEKEKKHMAELKSFDAESREAHKKISTLRKKAKAGTISEQEDEELRKLEGEGSEERMRKILKLFTDGL